MIKGTESEFNTQYQKDLVCPYCGFENDVDFEDYGKQDEHREAECMSCEKWFDYVTDYTVTFCTAKKQKEPVTE